MEARSKILIKISLYLFHLQALLRQQIANDEKDLPHSFSDTNRLVFGERKK
jgi:hypothetical protein